MLPCSGDTSGMGAAVGGAGEGPARLLPSPLPQSSRCAPHRQAGGSSVWQRHLFRAAGASAPGRPAWELVGIPTPADRAERRSSRQ